MEQKKALLEKAKRDIALVTPERLPEIEAYRCDHTNAKKRKIFCSECPSIAETEIENCFPGMEKTNKSTNDNKQFLDVLEELCEKHKNVKITVCKLHAQVTCTHSKNCNRISRINYNLTI